MGSGHRSHTEFMEVLRKFSASDPDAGHERAFFQSLCDAFVASGLFQLAWFGYADESTQKIVSILAHSGNYGGFWEDLETALRQTGYEDPANIAIRSGKVCWINNLRDLPKPGSIPSPALERGCTSVISAPVTWEGRSRGALTLYYSDPKRFGQWASDVLNQWLAERHFESPGQIKTQEMHEAELRSLIDAVPRYIGLIGDLVRGDYWNRAWLEFSGFRPDEIPFRYAELQEPNDFERVTREFYEQTSKGVPFEIVSRLRRRDGQFRWFSSHLVPLRDEQGNITRWCTIATDIHDQKIAEERLQNENIALREEVDRASMFEEIVGHSAKLRAVLGHVAKVAHTDSTVLITGETGTGKELIARAIHRRSARSNRAFVAVNCASIPSSLIASELFGHEKGAFTGAMQQRLGRFELADGGTLFLDEVGELPAEIQIALLRVLQEREVERLGGKRPISVDVRLITATNRDLDSAVADGAFRSDLFYRLSVFPIQVPSLRERPEDIPLLVEYFTGRFASKMGKRAKHIAAGAMEIFQSYGWPGNVRELQNVVERAVVLSDGDELVVDEGWLRRETAATGQRVSSLKGDLINREKQMIEAALQETGGRVSGPSGAAKKLRIPAPTLESKIRSLGINKYRFKGL